MCLCVCVRARACMYTHTHTHTPGGWRLIHNYSFAFGHAVCVYVCVRVCVCVCMCTGESLARRTKAVRCTTRGVSHLYTGDKPLFLAFFKKKILSCSLGRALDELSAALG